MNTLSGEQAHGADNRGDGRGRTRRAARILVAAIALSGLAACANVATTGGNKQAPVTTGQPSRPQSVADGTVKTAILLPLSGQQAEIGRGLLNAAELALFDVADNRLSLLPRDTGGTPQGAAAAAQKALADGATLIIGPLFAQEAAAVRPIAAAAGVDMLTLSNDRRLSGPGTHVLGLMPADQVARIVAYVRASGVTRFAVLAPRNPYGDVVAAAMQEIAPRLSVQVGPVERYDPGLTDLSMPAAAVAAAAPQAVLIAESGQRAQAMAQALNAAGVKGPQTRLLGAALWDEPGLGREPTLVGGQFAAPDPAARSDFEARYKSLFGQPAPRVSTLAYDATALAATIVKQRAGADRPLDRAALTSGNGFNGVDGLFRLRGDGRTERGLAVLEITPTGARIADPAPRDFNVLGQ